MIIAVIAAVAVMLIAAGPLANFIRRNPTIVMLALGFLLLIGTALIADGFGFHLPKATSIPPCFFRRGSKASTLLARKTAKTAAGMIDLANDRRREGQPCG